MTFVRDQSSEELAAHMPYLQKLPGWHDPLADRLWQEVQSLKAEVARSTEREILQLAELESLRKDAELNNRRLRTVCTTIGEICEALGIDNHSEPDMIVEAVREMKPESEALREANDKLSRRNGMLEQNVQVMTETHVLYTWLRKKADQPGHGVIAVAINAGPDWIVSHDLDKDLRALIDAEEP